MNERLIQPNPASEVQISIGKSFSAAFKEGSPLPRSGPPLVVGSILHSSPSYASYGKLRELRKLHKLPEKSSKIRKIRNLQQRGAMRVVYLISHDIRINNKQSTHKALHIRLRRLAPSFEANPSIPALECQGPPPRERREAQLHVLN